MPRTFLVRRTALQLHTVTSEDVKAVQVESVIQNTDSTVQECKPSYKERLADICTQKIEQPLIKANKFENLEAVNKSAVDQSPTYLSRAVSNAIRVDSVTGVIENKTLLLDCYVKEEPVDIELDAEVAYHTDKSFSSQQTFSRPTSFSSVNSSDSQTFQTSTYSDISEPVFQDLERTRSTSLSLPVIAPHQPLPPFASLVYNVFAAARKPMGETLQDTFDVEPSNIIKLPLKLPTRVEDGHEKYSTETVTDDSLNNVNKHTLIKTEEKVTKDARLENECGKNEEKDKTQIKSAHKIWNPFHHVSTHKTKVLPVSSVSSNHVPDMSIPQFSHQFVNSVTPAINNSYVSSTSLASPQLTISDLRSPETIMSSYNVTHGARSPYFSESNRSFQTISQINATQNFHPGFSPTIPSPFLPYPTYYTPDPYIRSHTVAHSRTSTPVASTASSTPVIQTERPISTGKKRPCTPVTETPKRMRINNLPFQIYQESASPSFVENSIHKLPYTCPVTPVLSRKSVHDQENIPINSNRTHIQLRTPIHSRSPAILGPSSISKENIPHSKLDETPVLKIFKDQPTPQNIEVINGGYGIKNPSFVPPKPADITNIQHDQTGKGSFICKVCGKDFAIQRLLNRHLKCHSETKRYLCTFCGKGFNDTFDLKRHTRIHTGVKPYKCNNCEKAFTQRCSLESHCRKVHNMEMNFGYKQRRNKTYVCEDCGHSTTDPEVHFNHLKERHPNCPTLAKPHDKRHFKFQSEKSSSGPLRPRN